MKNRRSRERFVYRNNRPPVQSRHVEIGFIGSRNIGIMQMSMFGSCMQYNDIDNRPSQLDQSFAKFIICAGGRVCEHIGSSKSLATEYEQSERRGWSLLAYYSESKWPFPPAVCCIFKKASYQLHAFISLS